MIFFENDRAFIPRPIVSVRDTKVRKFLRFGVSVYDAVQQNQQPVRLVLPGDSLS
jgi:hypothetical protein